MRMNISKCGLILALGILANVLIAWVCIARLPMPRTTDVFSDNLHWPHKPGRDWPEPQQQWIRNSQTLKVVITRSYFTAQTQRAVYMCQQMDVEGGFPF